MRRSATIPGAIIVLMLVALTIVSSPACTMFPAAPSGPVEVDLSLSKAPKLGESAELTFVVKFKYPADNVTIGIILPEGISHVSGDLTWDGEIPEGGTRNKANWDDKVEKKVELKAVVKAVKTGDWDIEAFGGYILGPHDSEGDRDHIYLRVAADSAKMSKTPPEVEPGKVNWGIYVPIGLTIEQLSLSQAPPLNETAELTCTVTARPNPDFSDNLTAAITRVTIEIDLPEGFSLVSGNRTRTEDLPVDKESKLEVKAAVKAIKTGDWVIGVNAKQVDSEGRTVGARENLRVRVAEGSSEFLPDPRSAPPAQTPLLLQVALSVSHRPPLLNKPSEFTWIVQAIPNPDLSNRIITATTRVTVQIVLPEGFSLVSGNLTWAGDLPTKESSRVEIKTVIQAIKTGYWIIAAYATQADLQGNTAGSWPAAYGYIISADSSTWAPAPAIPSDVPPSKLPSILPPSQPRGTPSTTLKTEPLAPSSTLLVTGEFHSYISQDVLPPNGQQRADVEVPTFWAGVRIYDGYNNLLEEGFTGPLFDLLAGRFELSITNPGPAVGFYVEFTPNIAGCHVTTASGSEYSTITGTKYPQWGQSEFPTGTTLVENNESHKGAWRIFNTITNDNYDRGAYTFLSMDAYIYDPPGVTVHFPEGFPVTGDSYYNPISDTVNIASVDDTKALDTVQHEYAHFILDQVYGQWPWYWPLTHHIRTYSDTDTAWGEGWADFFPLVAQ